jgi:hypothetical protein
MNNSCQVNQGSLSALFAKQIVTTLLSAFSGVALLTYLAQTIGLSFRVYAIIGLILILIAFGGGGYGVFRLWRTAQHRDIADLIILCLLCLAGSLIVLTINRPETDDFYYVPNAVFHLLNPDRGMDWNIHYLYIPENSVQSFFWATATPFEYSQTIVAHFLGMEYLRVYYVLTPALVGFLIPLAYYYVLSRFSHNTSYAILGAFLIIGMMLLLGETVRTVGNMYFARAFQGKAIFLSIGVPWFIAMSRDHFEKPSFSSVWCLVATNIAMIGITSTAIVFLPLLALVLAISEFFVTNNVKGYWRTSILYFSPLLYILVFAAITLNYSQTYLGASSVVNGGWPRTLLGHANFFYNPQLPLTPILAALFTITVFIFSSGYIRKYLFVWVFSSLILILNPLSADFLINHVTSPNIYWRLFYILPFPLVVGLSVVAFCERFNLNFAIPKGKAVVAFLLASVTLLQILFWNASVFSPKDAPGTSWAGYKLEDYNLAPARKIIAIAPPGVMLAPPGIGGTVAMLSDKYPQIRIRNDAENLWLGEDAEMRILSSDFVGGEIEWIDEMRMLLSKYPVIQSIVMSKKVWKNTNINDTLETYGFHQSKIIDEKLVLIWK